MSRGGEYRARAVVVATGYYGAPNPLDVPGESLPHVSHYYRDPLPYYRQRVLIVGGKNSAVEAALDLWRHGARVTLVHRGSSLSAGVKYWILPDFENRVADGSIRTRFETTVEEFRPGSTVVRSSNGIREEEETDFAFILIGYRPEIGFLKSLGIGVEADSLAPSHNPETMETNIPNLFVAGGMVGGRFNNRVFIENGRGHGKKIVDCLRGRV
jgi:thioredoxin reductase (NADPH)